MGPYAKTLLSLLICFLPAVLPVEEAASQPLGLMSQKPQSEPQICVLSTSSGRYVFGQVSDSAKDKFMLDTQTGRLWKISEKGTVGEYLKEIPYLVKKGTYSPLPGKTADDGADEQEKE